MFSTASKPIFHVYAKFGAGLLALFLLASCTESEDLPATTESTTETLLGEWALITVRGGIAGIDNTYTVETSPRSLDFQARDERNTVIDKQDTTTVTSSFFVEDVTTDGDTIFFSFSTVRDGSGNFVLSGRPMYLIDKRILQTAPICCDFLDYRFEKK